MKETREDLERHIKDLERQIYVLINDPDGDEANWFKHCWEWQWKKNRKKNLKKLKKYLNI